MLFSLNKIIKWLIIFLIVEVVLFAMNRHIEPKHFVKTPLYSPLLIIQYFPEVNTFKEKKIPIVNTVYNTKKTAKSFRIISLKTDKDVLPITNNVFGIWSCSKKDKRMVASEKRGEKAVYLKKYGTIHESIYDYLLTISKVSYYQSFREKRLETQDPFVLIEHLDKYSEQGDEYIANIKNIMKKNQLIDYDSYALNL